LSLIPLSPLLAQRRGIRAVIHTLTGGIVMALHKGLSQLSEEQRERNLKEFCKIPRDAVGVLFFKDYLAPKGLHWQMVRRYAERVGLVIVKANKDEFLLTRLDVRMTSNKKYNPKEGYWF